MSIPSQYLGVFHNLRGDLTVTFKADTNPGYVQYQVSGAHFWHRMPLKDWDYQVDAGTWIPDVPEYMQVSEGL